MRNCTPENEFRLKRQSICKISFHEEVQSAIIHQRTPQTQKPKETPFSAYLKSRIVKLRQNQVSAHKVRKQTIKIFHINNPQTPHDMFTDTHGKRLLSEMADTHQLNLQGLERISKSSEKNPFFLQVSGKASLVKQCQFHFQTEIDKPVTPAKRRITPQKPKQKQLDFWKDLKGWQIIEDTSRYIF